MIIDMQSEKDLEDNKNKRSKETEKGICHYNNL